MPGALPANSGYTYAVELSVDEAQAAGATQVSFDHPLYNYVTSFLNFPVGMAVPAGYYDRTQARWVASNNGVVIKILGQTGGLADVDANGDGSPDTPAQLAALGFTDAERQQLATLYTAGQTLWRVPVTHFTPWDYNWPYSPPPGATPPNQGSPDNPQGCGCSDCEGNGNVTRIERNAAGTPTAIVAPFGQRTALAVDGNGNLSGITNPAGGVVQAGYAAGGLLNSFTDLLGKVSTMTYDTEGRLTMDSNTAGGSTTLVRTEAGGTQTVTVTTAEGRTTMYAVTSLGAGGYRQVVTGPDGLQTVQQVNPDGTTTVTTPDGTVTTTTLGPDPRFGMLSPLTASYTVQTPGGLTYGSSEARTATLSNPDDLLSATLLVDTTTINGQASTDTYDAAAHTITSQTAEGRTTVTTLDNLGHIVQEAVPGVDPVNDAYDGRGLLTQVTQGRLSQNSPFGGFG
jgi:YD repeat-containing protein